MSHTSTSLTHNYDALTRRDQRHTNDLPPNANLIVVYTATTGTNVTDCSSQTKAAEREGKQMEHWPRRDLSSGPKWLFTTV